MVGSVAAVIGAMAAFIAWPREPRPPAPVERTAATEAALVERCRTLNLQTTRKIEADGTCGALVGEAHTRCSITAAAKMRRELRDCHRCSGPSVTDCMPLE